MFSASKSGQYGGYQISRSVRLRSSASAYFSRTPASAGNRKTFTISYWIKRGALTGTQYLFSAGSGTTEATWFSAGAFDTETISVGTWTTTGGITTAVFRDPSAWYHVVISVDTTQATAANRCRIFVNGVQQATSTPTLTLNADLAWNNSGVVHYIGARIDGGPRMFFDGYITEINSIDGQALTPASFGAYNAYGVWSPMKYNGTYGTNGFYLNFSDPSAATAAAIGKDYSGNGNNWTPNNISVTAGVTYDSFRDVPTPYADGSGGRGNYAVGNPLSVNVTTSATATLTNGNLLLTNGSATYSGFAGTIGIPTTGKWAWKFKVTGSVSGTNDGLVGFACNSAGNPVTGAVNGTAGNWFTAVVIQYISSRGIYHNYAGAGAVIDVAGSGGSGATNDEYEFLIDRGAGTTIVKLNGSNLGSTITGLPATQVLFPFATLYQTSGYFVFDYTPSDTSYSPLNTQNLPTPTIANGANYFAATTYTGTGASRSVDNTVNNVSFQPDFVWVKGRSGATDHALYDAVRGVQKQWETNTTTAETTETTGLTAFNSNGFTVGALAQMNTNTATYVAWQWKEGATQGFDIVTYTGNSTASRSVNHNLGVTPSMIFVKNRTTAQNNPVAHTSLAVGNLLLFDTTGASTAAGTRLRLGNSTAFTVGDAADYTITNQTGNDYVAYCFAAIAGFSAFGSYTGNGSADGPFVFTGFEPRWVMIKQSDAVRGWNIEDTSRNTFNAMNSVLAPQASSAESTNAAWSVDALSNGFKIRTSDTAFNASGGTYIFAAFAENPFKYSLAR